jgi:hypothetical protein|tara:strand:- start:190 stop:381 length:192 start_codon:yes stop_codon:yes gene_type:complete
MYTEEYTTIIVEIATLLDIEISEVNKFLELMLAGYTFRDSSYGCTLTTDECRLVLEEIQKRKK